MVVLLKKAGLLNHPHFVLYFTLNCIHSSQENHCIIGMSGILKCCILYARKCKAICNLESQVMEVIGCKLF